jgi:hypothetical protein
MKYLKALGLAMVAAAALAAFMGAANAEATVLCTNIEGAACNEIWGKGTKMNTQLETGKKFTALSTGGGEPQVACEESALQPIIENAGSATTTVETKVAMASITWGKCGTEKGVTISGGEIEFHWINKSINATVTGKGISVTFVDQFGFSCVFGLGATMIDIGKMIGGPPPKLELNAIAKRQAGSNLLCQESQVLTGEYEVLANGAAEAMYVREK